MSQLTDWIVKNTGTLCIGAMVGVSMVLPAGAVAQEPPKAPTCEEQTLNAVWRVRDGYEVQVSALVLRVQKLEAEKAEMVRAQAAKANQEKKP